MVDRPNLTQPYYAWATVRAMGGQQDESTYAPYNDNDLPPLHLAVVFPPILKYVIEYKESEASSPLP